MLLWEDNRTGWLFYNMYLLLGEFNTHSTDYISSDEARILFNLNSLYYAILSLITVGPSSVTITGNKPVYADEGATLMLTCTTDLVSFPNNYTIKWMNDTLTKELVMIFLKLYK